MDVKSVGEKHWQAEIEDSLQQVAVPEWGPDVVVYFRPRDTGEDRVAFYRAEQERTRAGLVYEVFLRKCLKEDGVRIWNDGERVKLMRHYDPAVIERVAMEIITRTRKAPSVEEAEGNSDATET